MAVPETVDMNLQRTDGGHAEEDGRHSSDHEDSPCAVDAQESPEGAQLSELIGLLRELRDAFYTKTQQDEAKRLLVSKMVDRLDALESDFLFREFRKPICQELIMLLDRVSSLSTQLPHDEQATAALKSIERELLEILKHQGVTTLEQPDNAFNEEIQEVLQVERTSDPCMDGIVLRVLRAGFSYRGTVLRPQGVAVARFKEEVAEDE